MVGAAAFDGRCHDLGSRTGMKCNWGRWLWGIIPLLVLGWVAVQAEHARLEADLTERARVALDNAGFPWALADFKARDAVLTGRAPQEGDPGKAADALAAVFGVRVVENNARLLDKADTYLWSASRRNNRVRLTGYAPSVSTKLAILGVTKASFPGFEIVDRTTLARGVPAQDVWLAGVSFGLKQLTSIKRGDIRMKDLEMAIAGEAEDIPGYRAIKQALANSVPKGIKVTSDLVTAPSVSPFTWSGQFANGRFILSGYVPNDAVRADLVATAKASLPGMSIIDKMDPGEGAPPGWAEMVIAGLRELSRLEGASFETKDAVLVVSGTAADGATAEAIRHALRAAVPASVKLTDQIRVKELPLPAPPPMPPPLPLPAPAEAPAKEPAAPTASRIDPPAQPVQPPPTAAPPAASQPTAEPPAKPAPPPEAVVKAKACEDELSALARAGLIQFRVGSTELDSASFETLDKLAAAAKSCPGMHIEVGGHASAEGGAEHNQQLSFRRAQSVVTYLGKAGVDAALLEAIGYGTTRPIAPNDTSENMAKNRRIEFTVRPK
jgi:OmpA-OmpF porin, OOP family